MGLLKTAAIIAVAASLHGRVQEGRQRKRRARQDAAAQSYGLGDQGSAAAAPSPAPAATDHATQPQLLVQLGELRGDIVTVSPGKDGLGTYAPPLDAAGNSVKGRLTARFLSARLGPDQLVSTGGAHGT